MSNRIYIQSPGWAPGMGIGGRGGKVIALGFVCDGAHRMRVLVHTGNNNRKLYTCTLINGV